MTAPGVVPTRIALLLESSDAANPELLRGAPSSFDSLAYVNTVHGVRPIHQPAAITRYGDELRPWTGPVQLPGASHCFRVPAGTALTRDRLHEALAGEGPLEAWDFSCPPREPGLVSVIIPTYRRVEALETAIESVIAQAQVKLELIVVDDNGEDRSFTADLEESLARAADGNSRCQARVVRHARNLGGAAARNTGFLATRGEYLCFLDDDDCYLPGRLAGPIQALAEAPDDVGGNYCGYRGWNSPSDDPDRYPDRDLLLTLLALAYDQHYLHTDTASYRFDHFLRTNGFDESYRRHQDLELNIRFLQGSTLAPFEQALVRLRPKPPRNDHRLFNEDLLAVKVRFLDDFSGLLEALDERTRERILRAHRDELLRNVKDADRFRASDPGLLATPLGKSVLAGLQAGETGKTRRAREPGLGSPERSLMQRLSRLWRRGR